MATDLKKFIAKELAKLIPNITPDDKKLVTVELGISRTTLDKYLTGNISKIEVGSSILKFMSERVKTRIEELNATTAA